MGVTEKMSLSQIVLAIDPGPERSGFILWDGTVIECGTLDNQSLRYRLGASTLNAGLCAIEMIASYGMPVGKEVFETCVWIGRFVERYPMPVHLVYRKDVKMHLCGTPRAKDGNIRAALIDKHGAPGTKKQKGPTYGLSGHLWAALAVADYAMENCPV